MAKSLCIPKHVLENEESTEGINIQTWIIPKEELGLPKNFCLNVWDFGGQMIYHATHQFFLTKRSLYLLVTESRKEDKHEDFYYWLNIIRLLGDRSPVILVLNKIDQPTKELPVQEYQQAFGNLVDFQRVSCQPAYQNTISALRDAICRILIDKQYMPHVGDVLPASWVHIREALVALRQAGHNYISYAEYLDLCREHGMDEEDRALFLSDYFHDLGVFLHFKDDLELGDTIFLNHEWVTAGVYKVLDSERVKMQKGRFDDRDLIHIWRDDNYSGKRRELLALMKNRKFEICYPLSNGSYLAPQLLPMDEIAYLWRSQENNLHFEYRYTFMPKGILSRFMVKRHKDIYQDTQWRYGLLLDYENTRALVREHYFQRKLTILLEGDNKRGFLEIIRNTIGEIHADFNNLSVDEMIPCNCIECAGSNLPHFYKYSTLRKFTRKQVLTVRCEQTAEEVYIWSLINEIEPTDRLRNDDWLDERRLPVTYNIRGNYISGHYVGGDMFDVEVVGSENVAIGRKSEVDVDR